MAASARKRAGPGYSRSKTNQAPPLAGAGLDPRPGRLPSAGHRGALCAHERPPGPVRQPRSPRQAPVTSAVAVSAPAEAP